MIVHSLVIIIDGVTVFRVLPFQMFLPIIETLTCLQVWASCFSSSRMAENHTKASLFSYAHIITMVPVVAKSSWYIRIAVISSFPYQWDRTRQFKVSISMIYTPRGGVYWLTEEAAVHFFIYLSQRSLLKCF